MFRRQRVEADISDSRDDVAARVILVRHPCLWSHVRLLPAQPLGQPIAHRWRHRPRTRMTWCRIGKRLSLSQRVGTEAVAFAVDALPDFPLSVALSRSP